MSDEIPNTFDVQGFLQAMFEAMIDSVEQPKMPIAEICALLLKTAREQRPAPAHDIIRATPPSSQPDHLAVAEQALLAHRESLRGQLHRIENMIADLGRGQGLTPSPERVAPRRSRRTNSRGNAQRRRWKST